MLITCGAWTPEGEFRELPEFDMERLLVAWQDAVFELYLAPFVAPANECGGQMQVVSFIEPPQTDVIEAILKHCGLWESRSPRALPEVHKLVLELDAAYSGNSLDAPVEADEFHELTYVDIDTFLTDL